MKKLFCLISVLFVTGCLYAQSADVVTSILETEEVNYGQVCYLSAIHQNLIEEDASYSDAVKALYDEGQLPELVDPYSIVYMANLSFIYMQIWPEVKGGLMYRITNGSPRYAFKQLSADGVLPPMADPKAIVSGREALNILTACMSTYGSVEEGMGMEIK